TIKLQRRYLETDFFRTRKLPHDAGDYYIVTFAREPVVAEGDELDDLVAVNDRIMGDKDRPPTIAWLHTLGVLGAHGGAMLAHRHQVAEPIAIVLPACDTGIGMTSET